MNIAIYSRKSKYTGKGESIENQIEICREYIRVHIGNVDNIYVYEDEGFSAKDTDRPEFQRMMKDLKKKMFDFIMCYRLDRLTRSVLDFSELIEIMQKNG